MNEMQFIVIALFSIHLITALALRCAWRREREMLTENENQRARLAELEESARNWKEMMAETVGTLGEEEQN